MDNTKLIAEAKEAVEEWSSLWTTFVTPEAPRRLVTELRVALEAAEAELTRRDTVIAAFAPRPPGSIPYAGVGADFAVNLCASCAAAPVSLEAVKAETTDRWGCSYCGLDTAKTVGFDDEGDAICADCSLALTEGDTK